jgi:hypothetical protein
LAVRGGRKTAARALLATLLLSSSALAQETPAEIARRIETTFGLVLGNTAELAIPLTRRALARRLSDDEGRVEALAYGAAEPDGDGASAAVEEDPDLARLPRPRPAQPDDPASEMAETDSGDPAPEMMESDSTDPAPEIAEAGVGGPALETEDTGVGGPAGDEVALAENESAGAGDDVVGDALGGPLDLVAAPASQDFAASELAAEALPSAPVDAAASTPSAPDLVATGSTEPSVEQLELVASGACLSVADVTDKDEDFKRNAAVLSENTLCIAEEQFKERRRTWTIATVKTGRPGPLFAVMHDDEDMSFDKAVAALKTYGGTLVAVETGGKRNQDGVDPNRNFSADGIGCRKLGKDASPKYTEVFRNLFDPTQPIVALHNNTGERIPTGGHGHVSMDDLPKDMEAKKSADPDGPLAGDRSLVLLASAAPITSDAETRAAELSAKGINAVIEPVSEGKGDCSFSNYALLSGHAEYFNVTVDEGEGDKQRQIIDAILAKPDQTVATQ